MSTTTTTNAQELKKAKGRAARKRANDRARQAPGIAAFERFMKSAYDAQQGLAYQKPNAGRGWKDLDCAYPTASWLLRHADRKTSISITWGQKSTMRAIDADAHGSADRMTALPALWESIQAIHFGREVLLPELVDGKVPEGVKLDGVITTSPNGLYYLERTVETSPGDRLEDDKARILACFRQCGVTVRSGRIEVFPASTGQSRLPLGHGFTFVYPPLGDVGFEAGLEILAGMTRVRRDFPDVINSTPRVPTIYEGEGASTGEVQEYDYSLDAERVEEERAEHLANMEQPSYVVAASNERLESAKVLHRRIRRGENVTVTNPTPRVPTIYEGRGLSQEGKSEFVCRMEQVIRDGATVGERNRASWEVCMFYRLTRGFSRDETESRVMRWIDDAPHTSGDLSNLTTAKRAAAIRTLRTHLNKLDAKLASGEFYQLGNGTERHERSTTKAGDAVLLNPTSHEQRESFRDAGIEFLRAPNGDSLLTVMPDWICSTLPILVGAIMHWSRNGAIAIPTATVKEYAGTCKPKVNPIDGTKKPAYMVLIALLEHFGVVAGIVRKAHKANRLAAIYETNTAAKDEHAIEQETTDAARTNEGSGRADASVSSEVRATEACGHRASTADGTHESVDNQPDTGIVDCHGSRGFSSSLGEAAFRDAPGQRQPRGRECLDRGRVRRGRAA